MNCPREVVTSLQGGTDGVVLQPGLVNVLPKAVHGVNAMDSARSAVRTEPLEIVVRIGFLLENLFNHLTGLKSQTLYTSGDWLPGKLLSAN
jgi:hypothetical protein